MTHCRIAVWSLCLLVAFATSDINDNFEAFVSKYNKKYSSQLEYKERSRIFSENVEWIKMENQKNFSYTVGVTQFSDLRDEEFDARYQTMPPPPTGVDASAPLDQPSPEVAKAAANGPDRVDWVEAGKVSSVKNQGHCETCWTFSTAGAVESALAISKRSAPADLSEQELQDCREDGSAPKCMLGGWPKVAIEYVAKHGLSSYADYPYIANDETCTASSHQKAIAPGVVQGVSLVEGSKEALMVAAAKQPVSVVVGVLKTSPIRHYKNGIISSTCRAASSHAVLVVGYGEENGMDYWKIKNSWGADWGESGYFRLERGVPGQGECGLLAYPVVPVMAQTAIIV